MKRELDEALCAKYPKIFADRNKGMTETCMCWGFEHGDGWYWLIDQLCRNIQSYIDNNDKDSQVVATQVKEKFGGLRFYYNGGNDYVHGMVRLAESMSYHICEQCGSTKNVSQTKGWIYTLCEDCLIKKNEVKLNKKVNVEEFEICVLCGCQTDVLKSTNIAMRLGYIEGVGQLCEDCWKCDNKSDELETM